MIFGQLGNDTIQGDGSIDARSRRLHRRVGAPRPTGAAGVCSCVAPSHRGRHRRRRLHRGRRRRRRRSSAASAATTSSAAARTCSRSAPMAPRPDGSDLIFGGAGTDVARNDAGDRLPRPPTPTRSSATTATSTAWSASTAPTGTTATSTFTYDTYASEPRSGCCRARSRCSTTPPGGPDLQPDLFPDDPDRPRPGRTASTSGAPTRCTASPATTRSTSAAATTWSSATPATTTSSAAGATTGSPAAPAPTASSATTAASSPAATARRTRAAQRPRRRPASTRSDQHAGPHPGRRCIYPTGQLNKTVDLTPFALDPRRTSIDSARCPRRCYANDVIFGGLGDDFLHGGAGDDAVSGAEALVDVLRARRTPAARRRRRRPTGTARSTTAPCSASTPPTGEFVLYDEYDPRRTIMLNADGTLNKTGDGTRQWFLNNRTPPRAGCSRLEHRLLHRRRRRDLRRPRQRLARRRHRPRHAVGRLGQRPAQRRRRPRPPTAASTTSPTRTPPTRTARSAAPGSTS